MGWLVEDFIDNVGHSSVRWRLPGIGWTLG